MKLIHRLGYYLGGFAIGLIFLAFFLSGKRASCAYGPEARVLKNIAGKSFSYSDTIAGEITQLELDTFGLRSLILNGDVDFGKSDTKLDSCRQYHIESDYNDQLILMRVANCDSLVTILSFNKK